MLLNFVKENWLFVLVLTIYILIWVISHHYTFKKIPNISEEQYKNALQYEYDRENDLNSEN